MKRDDSAACYFNRFLGKLEEEQKIYGFISNGLTVLTTEKDLGDLLYINARVRAIAGDASMPINIEDIGFQIGKETLLSDNVKNIALFDGLKLKNSKNYFDSATKRYNPVDKYYTAMILCDIKAISDAKSVVDKVVNYHIDKNNIEATKENEYKYVPSISMNVSRNNNPGICKHFNRVYQFQVEVNECMKMMIDSIQRDMEPASDSMDCQ